MLDSGADAQVGGLWPRPVRIHLALLLPIFHASRINFSWREAPSFGGAFLFAKNGLI